MLPTKILPNAVLHKLKKQPRIYSSLKRSLNICRGMFPKVSYDGLPGRIHPNDFMLMSYSMVGKKQYLDDSKLQFQLITDTLMGMGKSWKDIGTMIDIGSGYGRILRWAAQELSSDAITSCDVNSQAVHFCEKEFSVKGIVTNPNFSKGNFQSYDLIYSCSLLTHLTEENTFNYFKKITDIANCGAVLIFSLHGKSSIDVASKKINSYLDEKIIRKSLAEKGFYYHPYSHYPDGKLGDTFFQIDYLEQLFSKHHLPIKIHAHIQGPAYGWLHDWLVCIIDKKTA